MNGLCAVLNFMASLGYIIVSWCFFYENKPFYGVMHLGCVLVHFIAGFFHILADINERSQWEDSD